MVKNIFSFILVLSSLLYTLAGNPEEEYFAVVSEAFKSSLVDKLKLNCGNYETYCENVGENQSDIDQCKYWMIRFLCQNATDPPSIKKTIEDIKNTENQ